MSDKKPKRSEFFKRKKNISKIDDSFYFMTQALSEALDSESEKQIEELKEDIQEKEEQFKDKQKELYDKYKNIYISTEDIKELYKIVKEVEGIETSKEIETKINNYNEKHIKLLYLISKLDKQQQVVELENKITINDKRCKYGFCNEDSTFNDIKQTQEAGNEQYIGLVFGKRSKGEDIKNIYNLINANKNFENTINALEEEQTKLLTEQIDQYKSSITNLENQLEGIQQRKDELLGLN